MLRLLATVHEQYPIKIKNNIFHSPNVNFTTTATSHDTGTPWRSKLQT